jgi:hypothetical protein
MVDKFSEAMIRVRYVFVRDDGEIIGYSNYELQFFGWNIPVIGDKILRLHDVPLYDPAVVVDRIFVDEAMGDYYWLLVLKMEEESKFMSDVANHMWLVTDLERLSADQSVPLDEISVRSKQLTGWPSGHVRRTPLSRDPEPDRGWDDEDDATP